MSTPFKYGFTLDWWKLSLHVMLQKETVPYIHRLRIIQLFEADYNGALKILARRLLANTEEHHLN